MGDARRESEGNDGPVPDRALGDAFRALPEPTPSPGLEGRMMERMRARMAEGPGGGAPVAPTPPPRARLPGALRGVVGVLTGLAAALLITVGIQRLALPPDGSERPAAIGAGSRPAFAQGDAAPLEGARLLAEHERALASPCRDAPAGAVPAVAVPEGLSLASVRVVPGSDATQFTWVGPGEGGGRRDLSLFYYRRVSAPMTATAFAIHAPEGWTRVPGAAALRFQADGADCVLLGRAVAEKDLLEIAESVRVASGRASLSVAPADEKAQREAAAGGALSR